MRCGGLILCLLMLSTVAMAQRFDDPLDQGSDLIAQAQVKAKVVATLASEIDGTIVKIPFHDGQAFVSGDVLVAFDCVQHEAELSQATAAKASRKIAHNANVKLEKLGGVSEVEVADSKAKLLEAQAQHTIKAHRVKKCNIKAPFSGSVIKLDVNPHETVKQGQPLIEILDNHNLVVEIIVPSEWLHWLKVGAQFQLHIFETNKTYPGEVKFIIPKIDSISQSIRVLGVIKGHSKGLLSGMSGKAIFNTEQEKVNEQ